MVLQSFFSHILKEEKEKHNYTRAQAIMKIYDRWIKSQVNIETKLIDQEVHKFITKAKAYGATIIGFTVRQPVIAAITKKQLDGHKIYLDEFPGFQIEEKYKTQIFPDDEWYSRERNAGICENDVEKLYYDVDSLFYKGILFTHDLVKKGMVFREFYKQYQLHLENKNLPMPKRILFIDDGIRHLVFVEEEARNLGLSFQGFHISDDFKYDPAQAELEEASFTKD